jgi:hypothetical protein
VSRQGIAVAVIESTDLLAIALLVFDVEACTRESVGGKLLYGEADRITAEANRRYLRPLRPALMNNSADDV